MSDAVLVTGAGNFLGYHVIKLLNERGVRPRALIATDAEPTPGLRSLDRLDVERVDGSVDDPDSVEAACAGIATLLHLHFLIDLGGGPEAEARLHEGNVVAARNVLDAATRANVARVVVSSSALAIGLNRKPEPLDENADWNVHGYSLPYAASRREAEQEALARPAGEGPLIVAVSPSFTMGPEDFVGAPANGLAMKMASPRFRLSAPIGFGILDVRDYADGVLRAAENGRHGLRYILSGENVMPRGLLDMVAEVVGRKPPRWAFSVRLWMIKPVVAALGLWSKLRDKPPKVTSALLELWGRFAWYDASLARNELGWEPRPLRVTLEDSIAWQQANSPAD